MIRKLVISTYISGGPTETAFNTLNSTLSSVTTILAAMAGQAIDSLPVEIWREIFDEFLVVDFRLPFLQPSVPWSRRKLEFDVKVRYSKLLKNRGRLRLVSKKWNALVQMYPWRCLDLLGRLDGPPPEYHSGGVHWAVYPFSGGYHQGDRLADIVQSANTIVVLTLLWRAKSSITKLYSLFAHAFCFRRLQQLVISLTSEDRTCNDFATYTFFSHINVFSSTLVSLHLRAGLFNSFWFESPPVLRLDNLLNLDLCFEGFMEAFNISEWNCPKLTHLMLTGTIENTNYLRHLASIGSKLQFLSLRRITSGKPFTDPHSYYLRFNDAFWRTFPLLEVLKVDGASRWGSELTDLPLSHPIRELIVQRSYDNPRYEGMDALFRNLTASNDTTERKRNVTLEDVNWNHRDFASLKWKLMRSYASIAVWLHDEEGSSLRLRQT